MPPVSPYPMPNVIPNSLQMEYQNHQQRQQQQQQKFGQIVYGNQMHQKMAGIPEQFGTTSQISNNSNEESSGSEHRRK
jgi:hypothetical protein